MVQVTCKATAPSPELDEKLSERSYERKIALRAEAD
jgi:hypothetical protein